MPAEPPPVPQSPRFMYDANHTATNAYPQDAEFEWLLCLSSALQSTSVLQELQRFNATQSPRTPPACQAE